MTLATPALSRIEERDRLTEAQFMDLAPEKPKAELIDGVMIMSSPATVIHEDVQGFLFAVLRGYAETKRLGKVLGPNAPVRLGPSQIYSPDVMFISTARLGMVNEKEVRGAPDFVAEFLSAGTARYDRGRKREVCEEAGLRELWLIDPYGPVGCRFYQRRDERFVEVDALDGQINSIAVSGFFLRLNWLWPEGAAGPVSSIDALRELGVL